MIIEVSPEPGPNFTAGKQLWGIAWPIFHNSYGIIFGLLFIYAFKNIVALITMKHINFQRKKLFIVVNCILAYFSLISSLSLLLDPYNSGEYFKNIKFRGIIFLIMGTRLPCLTASFSLITMSLLEVTKLQVYSKRLQNHRCIYGIISVHFLLGLTTDVVLLFVHNAMVYMLLCQIAMVAISVSMSIASMYAGCRIIIYYRSNINTLRASSPELKSKFSKDSLSDLSKNGKQDMKLPRRITIIDTVKRKVSEVNVTFRDKSVRKITKMTLVTATFGILYGVIVIYSLVAVFKNEKLIPGVWAWYVIQVCLTFVELGMVASMIYIVRRGISINAVRKCFTR